MIRSRRRLFYQLRTSSSPRGQRRNQNASPWASNVEPILWEMPRFPKPLPDMAATPHPITMPGPLLVAVVCVGRQGQKGILGSC